MSFYANLTEALQAVRTELGDRGRQINEPDNYQKLTGTLNWLFSPDNPDMIQKIMRATSDASKYRPVEIAYNQYKGTGDMVTTDASASCAAVDPRRKKIQTLNPTLFAMDKFTIDDAIIREGNTEQIQAQLTREIRDASRNIRENINSQLLSKMAANMGSNPAQSAGAGTYSTIELLKADGTVSADNFDQIVTDTEDNFMNPPVGIIGLGKARKYMNRLSVGNVNDGGVDVGEVMSEFGMALFKDQDVLASLGGADRVLALYKGMQSFFNYNLYSGSDFDQFTPDFATKSTIPDPVYGYNLDFKLKYDDGCDTGNGLQGAWTGSLFTYFDLWTVPEDAFGDEYGDLNDFNGIVGYDITQA